ncbi:hypothetical protein P7C70_g5100, partial [Phenoliferia sp. Uapishka_3]
MPHSPSHSPTASSSGSSVSPNASRINLPPNHNPVEGYFDGEAPNVLVDRALGLHSKGGVRPALGSRSESLMTVLSNASGGKRKKHGKGEDLGESEGLLAGQESADEDEDEDGATTDGQQEEQPHHRSARSRSKSQWRKVKWYQRPSPVWFLPGTLLMSLSIGMIMSPKIEIFTQLICRAISAGPQDHVPNTVILPPTSPSTSPIASYMLRTESDDGVAQFVQQAHITPFKFENWETSEDGSWAKQCRSKPEVQRAVASLSLTLALLMGVLSSLTTGFWGALSDRRGRKPVLCLALFGMFVMDAIFLIVVNFHEVVGYRFLLVGPAFDGMLGGMSTASAATNAYLSDCTEAGSRARLFSIIGGILFGGIAIGPTIGSLIIRWTGSILSPFYLAMALHLLYLLVALLFIPESLSTERQIAARLRHKEDIAARRAKAVEESDQAREDGVLFVVLAYAKKAVLMPWAFLRPLNLILPTRNAPSEEDTPVLRSRGPQRQGWDWELTKIAVGYALYVMVVSATGVKLQYTQYKFSWGPQENGYYLSFIGGVRMLVLLVLLPVLIKIFHKSPPLPLLPRPDAPSDDTSGRPTPAQIAWESDAKYLRVVHDSHFDLFLARMSIGVDVIGYAVMALNGGSQGIFLISTAIQSLGGGAAPAIQSLALAHASPRDSGRLFASLSVLSSISASIVGPIIFSIIYIRTVAFFPELIYWAAFLCYGIGFIGLLAVRLGRKIVDGEVLVDLETPHVPALNLPKKFSRDGQGAGRGRSVTRKPGTLSDSGVVLRDD